jgi:hypothetical protein
MCGNSAGDVPLGADSTNRENFRSGWRGATFFCAMMLGVLAAGAGLQLPAARAAQQQPQGEVAANLAAGRVVFCVTKTAIVVAATQENVEKGSRAPAVVAVSSRRIGVLLGAVEWNTTAMGAKAVRLDAELPTVAANATRRSGNKQVDADQPNDIEEIGIGMLESLRPLVDQIHHKLDLAQDESLVELLLADYVEDYGPEIWKLQFRVRQENLGNDYWVTRVLRPAYTQLYPPEKGQPRTFVEAQYPEKLSQPGLLQRLGRHDPGVENIRNASPDFTKAIGLVVAGNSEKADAKPVVDFMRAVMPVVSGTDTRLVMGLLDGDRGFQWVLPPEEKLPTPTETKPQEPGAPSLRKYTPRN